MTKPEIDKNEMNDSTTETLTSAIEGEQNGGGHEQSYESVGVATAGITAEHAPGPTE